MQQRQLDNHLNRIVADHVGQLTRAIAQAVRQNIGTELARLVGAERPAAASLRRSIRGRKPRILPCIAPGCGSPSKGPRFRYLCARHLDAPRKDYEAWREARRAAVSA